MKIYLLSIQELQEKIVPEAACVSRLDSHRREKAEQMKAPGARYLSIGAGLLLQLAGSERSDRAQIDRAQVDRVQIETFSVTQLLCRLERNLSPREFTYVYGAKGKPQFADKLGGTDGFPFFNLSHSGSYVCCAAADREVGIDIQQMRPMRNFRVADRYFSAREREALDACEELQLREQLFYEIWVKKEAYAKLTGEGIGTGISIDTMPSVTPDGKAEPVVWHGVEAPAGYCMAVCIYRKDAL